MHPYSTSPAPLDTQRLFSHENSSFQMFSSDAYGQKNLLFKDATSELVPIATQTYEAWLGPEYLRAMKGLLCDSNRKSSHLFPPAPAQPDCRTGKVSWRGGQGGHHPRWWGGGTCCFHCPASGVRGGSICKVAWVVGSLEAPPLRVASRPSGSVLGKVPYSSALKSSNPVLPP